MVSILAATGLVAACGSDDAGNANGSDGRDITDFATIDPSESATAEETTADQTTTDEPTEAQGGGSDSGSGDFDGWATVDEAAADLETIGVSCEVHGAEMKDTVGLYGDWEGPFADCDPEAMVVFPASVENFVSEMEELLVEAPDDYDAQLIVGDNWVMACEEVDFTACEATTEYTGIQPEWL